jgi:hypothetical protein
MMSAPGFQIGGVHRFDDLWLGQVEDFVVAFDVEGEVGEAFMR